jgi:chaperonin GroES
MSKKTPIPFQDRVIVTRTKPETKSPGGIIIPEMAFKEDICQGIVVAIGPQVGRSNSNTKITANKTGDTYPKPGDLIQFGDYVGKEITYEGEQYLIMREADIMCKL